MPRTSDKRERLVAAVKTLIQQQGYMETSLAEIAKTSHVPLGNVYYYFKTKDDLAEAVITEHLSELQSLIEECEREETTSKGRLRHLVRARKQLAKLVAQKGCPVGSLCQELNKNHSALSEKANSILATELEWVQKQFTAMNLNDASDLAKYVLIRFQGASLLANSLNDPNVLLNELESLMAWIDSL